MNNILWLVNPVTFKREDFFFPAYLSRLNNSTLTALLMEARVMEALPVFSNDVMFPTREYTIADTAINEESNTLFETGTAMLEKYAEENGIELHIRSGSGDPLEQMVVESTFADLVLVHSNLTFSAADDRVPSDFILELLPKAKCPVLVMPDDMQEIKELYFTYNGKYSSVYSIRQFTYLFPQFKDLPVTILTAPETEEDIPHKEHLKTLLQKHYSNITFKILNGDAENALMIELMPRKNAMVTFGAFGRNKISRFFKRSGADNILHVINIPLFITHP